MCVCVRARVCLCVCAHARSCVCVCARGRACVRACARVCVILWLAVSVIGSWSHHPTPLSSPPSLSLSLPASPTRLGKSLEMLVQMCAQLAQLISGSFSTSSELRHTDLIPTPFKQKHTVAYAQLTIPRRSNFFLLAFFLLFFFFFVLHPVFCILTP